MRDICIGSEIESLHLKQTNKEKNNKKNIHFLSLFSPDRNRNTWGNREKKKYTEEGPNIVPREWKLTPQKYLKAKNF